MSQSITPSCEVQDREMRLPSVRKTWLQAGFSLPEVAIAVAIAALGLVTLLGIIPSGLDSIRFAGETTAEARVVSQVLGEIQMSDWGKKTAGQWSKLEQTLQRRWYFDDQANPVDVATTSATNFENRITYVVRVRPNTVNVTLPGAPAPYEDTKSVLVDIAVTPNSAFDFAPGRTFRTRPALLVRQFSKGS